MKRLLIVGVALCGLAGCTEGGGGDYSGGSGDALIAAGLGMLSSSSQPVYVPSAPLPVYYQTACRSTPWGAQCVTQ